MSYMANAAKIFVFRIKNAIFTFKLRKFIKGTLILNICSAVYEMAFSGKTLRGACVKLKVFRAENSMAACLVAYLVSVYAACSKYDMACLGVSASACFAA